MPMSVQMTRREMQNAFEFLQTMCESFTSAGDFARLGVNRLPQLISSEITTLSVCNLRDGRRTVIGSPPGAIAPRDVAVFDRFFFTHPLVRFHAAHGAE